MVSVSTGHEYMGGTRNAGIMSGAADLLGMSVVRGMRGVAGVCEMCLCLGCGGMGVVGGEWMRAWARLWRVYWVSVMSV